MNNLYHKVAVASVCTALGFALGANEEAYSAIFTLPPTINFLVIDDGVFPYLGFDGVGDRFFPMENNSSFASFGQVREVEVGLFSEFNIDSFSFLPNEDISRVLLQTQVYSGFQGPDIFAIFGYVGNGTGDLSDYGAGELLSSVDLSSSSPGDLLTLDVTPFVKQRVSNGDSFAGFGFRRFNFGLVSLGGDNFPDFPVRMVVETADVAEPVPEPTTIFGSAIALGLGGWLKRKKSNQQHKTRSQG